MQIQRLYPNASFGSNCYLLLDSGHAAVVDPSVPAATILAAAEGAKCSLDAILLTHGHFDHIFSIDTLRSACPELQLYIHAGDAPMLSDGRKNAFFTFFGQDRQYVPAEQILTDGQVLTLGRASLTVLHTPGHSPGSVCYLNAEDGILLTGDTLFAMDVGRCDLWGGDHATLLSSLERLKALDPALTVYPGHGESARLSAALGGAFYNW